ncbi:MAG TPA: radical SAM protein [Candidatus Bathyarchaeia archaeon]|nr:radical SAM protein [Candidatus Bathyarchaeia archaeon]
MAMEVAQKPIAQKIERISSLCPVCDQPVQGCLQMSTGRLFLERECPVHGKFSHLFEDDSNYYHQRHAYWKPGTDSKRQTLAQNGCPFDCGLCPNHQQHTCIGVMEITSRCDAQCPICYAAASRESGDLDLKTVGRMLDFYAQAEGGHPEIVQISGGEPTLHPQVLDIIRLARQKVKYVMLNTNGRRIAEDADFVKALAKFQGNFEVYLQFDGFASAIYKDFRSQAFEQIKFKAVENLIRYKIPMTLVATIKNGVNDGDIGALVKFGMQTKFVRGISFQPLAYFSPDSVRGAAGQISLTGILKRMREQTKGEYGIEDFVPLPCNVDRVAVAYFYRQGDGFVSATRKAKIKNYLPLVKNTFAFNVEDFFKEAAGGLARGEVCQCMSFLKDFMPVAPLKLLLKGRAARVQYVNDKTFRMTVTSFVDRLNCDLNALKKECVHIITPDLKRVPFSAYNMFYRQQGGNGNA